MDNLAVPSVTACLTNVALAAGTTTTINTPGSPAGSTVYTIKSKVFTKAALANGATPTLDATTGVAFLPISANQGTVVLLGFDATGNLKASQGPVQALDAAGAFVNVPQFPVMPDTICPFGYILLKGGATLVGTFVFGTNNLSAVTGMTYTFVSIALGLPDRPQAS